MPSPLYHVDAFTHQPFRGNPAAVCLLDRPAEPGWMQKVASEMNLSETAFLLRREDGYGLRWFTPTVEVDLCGHATLASAHVLWQRALMPVHAAIAFFTKSGVLTARKDGAWIELDFPLTPDREVEKPSELERALGARALYVGKSRFDLIVELESDDVVRGLAPDFVALARIPARAVIVTSRSAAKEYDFVSRFFGPQSGVNEDPVTGSAHCCLASFWQKRLGKSEFFAYQASPRGGEIGVRIAEDRAILRGQAVITAEGSLVC